MESKMTIYDIANYLIAKSDNVGDLITNKKLQKLLYYVKAWGLVYFQPEGIISEDFEAWIHGPVCPAVYRSFKSFGYNPLKIDYKGQTSSQFIDNFRKRFAITDRENEKINLIDDVFEEYAQSTSFQLEMLSHTEKPWLDAREGLRPNETGNVVINEETMRTYYAQKIQQQ